MSQYVASLVRLRERLDDLIDKLDELTASLSDLVKRLRVMAAPSSVPAAAGLPAYHYGFFIEDLFRWLEHAGLVYPTIVEAPITVSAGERGYADLWLPPGIACVERVFELTFTETKGLRFGWMVDSTTDWTVPMHYFIPNKGQVEESVFGRHWIKWHFLRFHYHALRDGQIVIRAWARLVKHDDLDRLIEIMSPLAEMFQVKYPAPRPTPVVTGSKLVKRCKACGAELYEEDGKPYRKGEWGRSYADHECEVFK